MIETLIHKLQNGRYITLETTPAQSPTFENVLEAIAKNDLQAKIDGFTTTDSPLAKMRYSSVLASIKLQQRFNLPAIATMTMRDKNIIALQGEILGANDFDLQAFLALTGDPIKMGDHPMAKGVFEGNSNTLLATIKSLNASITHSGKPIKITPKPIYAFSVTNSYAKNFGNIKKRLVEKIKNGSVGIITQPIFELENARIMMEIFDEARAEFTDERADAQLIFGLFPITKLRSAQFLSTNVPGIHVSDRWLDALSKASKISEEEERKVGLEMSIELTRELLLLNPRLHIMTSNNFTLAREILENL